MNSEFQLEGKTKKIIETFERLSAIPRTSGNEDQIRRYLVDWARQRKFLYIIDRVGNLIIKVPGSKSKENCEPVVIQGHLDMVGEKIPQSDHDFYTDPIKLVQKGEWLYADNTTLGADNGIAIALAMCVADDEDVIHPPLEFLFTVEEETGLTGAAGMDPEILQGRQLINIDSEDEGHFTIGCAGGMNTQLELALVYEKAPREYKSLKISVSGLSGGHSGVNIHEERANAIRLLTRALCLLRIDFDLRLSNIYGGTAHNAIPRDAFAEVFVPSKVVGRLMSQIDIIKDTFKNEFRNTDPHLNVVAEKTVAPPAKKVVMSFLTLKVLNLLLALPHGVASRSTEIGDMVETSSNLAQVYIENGILKILSSQRSSVLSSLQAHTMRITSIGNLAGARIFSDQGYPSWQPDVNSRLLKKSCEVYEKVFSKKPVVETIHAGLECGLIGDKHEGMDMISIGPTLENPHSPDERLNLPSVEKIWKLLVYLLAEL